MAAITEFINEKLYPALWSEIGSIFPEMEFKLVTGKWRSPKKIDGTDPKVPTRSKTVVTPAFPNRALENGGESIDLITLYMNLNNKATLWEAISELASKLNLELPTSGDEEKWKEYRELREQRALSYDRQKRALFNKDDPQAAKVLKYLTEGRGYDEPLIKDMGLGYISPAEARTLEERGKVGITCNVEDFPLSFPYFSNGNVEGFCFRYISEEQIRTKYPDGTGKYRKTRSLNGIENKNPFGLISNSLYKGTSRREAIIVVEGELDALHAIALGVENVIATSGGKVTPETISSLKKKGYKDFILILDTDGAGQRYTRESIIEIHKAGLNSYVATLPDAKDLDEYLGKHTVEELNELTKWATFGSLFLFWKEAEAYSASEQTPRDTDKFLESVVTLASQERDPIKSHRILQHLKDNVLSQMDREIGIDEIRKGIEEKVEQQRKAEENKRLREESDKEFKQASALLAEGKTVEASKRGRKAVEILQMAEDRDKYARLLQDRTEEIYESYKNKPKGLITNFDLYNKADNSTHELFFPSGAISVIGALTGHGKSKILQSLALDALEQKEDGLILFLTYEESEESVNLQFFNAFLNIELTKKTINYGNLRTLREYYYDPQAGRKYIKSGVQKDRYGNTLHDNTKIIPTLEQKEKEWKELRKSGRIRIIKPEDNYLSTLLGLLNYAMEPGQGKPEIKAVFVDYIQELYIQNYKTYGRPDELKEIMVELDLLAQKADIPIILGAQLSKEAISIKHLINQVIADSNWINRKASEIVLVWSSKEKGTETVSEKELIDMGATYIENGTRQTMVLGQEGKLYLKVTKSRNIPINSTAVVDICRNTGRVTGNITKPRNKAIDPLQTEMEYEEAPELPAASTLDTDKQRSYRAKEQEDDLPF